MSPHYAATTTNSNGSTGLWHNVFENLTTAQFDHRVLATTTTYIAAALLFASSRRAAVHAALATLALGTPRYYLRWPVCRSCSAFPRCCISYLCPWLRRTKRAVSWCSLPSTSSSRCAGLVPLHARGDKPIWREERERQRQPGKSPKLSYDFHFFTLGDIQGRRIMYPQTLRGQSSLRHPNADALAHPVL